MLKMDSNIATVLSELFLNSKNLLYCMVVMGSVIGHCITCPSHVLGWLVGQLVCQLVGQLISQLVGQLVGRSDT
jgi:hypothetical protein